jgi:hypothetical protein
MSADFSQTAVIDRRYGGGGQLLADTGFPAIWELENFQKLSVIQTFHPPFAV